MTKMAPITTDDIFIQLKPFGRIQKLFFMSSMYMMFFMPMLDQSIVFMGASPEHHCVVPDGYFINQTIPLEEDGHGELVYSQCHEYVDPDDRNATVTRDCQNGWEYSREFYGETIISEWDLVCVPNPASETSQSILQIGGMFGAVVFGKVADSYGRRSCLRSSLIVYNLAVVAICFSPSFTIFLVLQFLSGFGQMGTYGALTCIVSEYMIPKYRNASTTIPQLSVTFGLMSMALWAFLIPDWRYFQLAIHAPVLVASFGLWFLPESLRWLIIKNKSEKVKGLIRRLSDINGSEIPITMYDEEKGAPAGQDSSPETGSDKANGPQRRISSVSFTVSRDTTDTNMDARSSATENKPESVFRGFHETPKDERGIFEGRRGRRVDADPENDTSADITDSEADTNTRTLKCPSANNNNSKSCYNLDDDEPRPTDPTKTAEKPGDPTMTVDDKAGNRGYLDLFKPPVLRVTLVMSVFRFTICLVYFGFALNSGALAGNPYLNFFFMALVEVPAKLISPLLNKWYRRTYLVTVCYTACSLSLVATMFTPDETKNGTDLGTLIVVLSLAGKFFVTLSQAGLMLLIMELFPTTLRNVGNGFTLCAGRVGGILAPFMLYADYFIPHFSTMLMAGMSAVTAVIILTLPDTRKTPQPQNTADLKELFNGSKEKYGIPNKAFEANENEEP